jgi:cytoskeleton protein RodZ
MSEESKRGDEDRPQAARSPGERLRAARETRGLETGDAAEALGVAGFVIAALEADEFERLGAPVYVRGYLRKYGRFLGLSGDELVAAYEEIAAPHDPEVHAHATTALPRRSNTRWLAPATAAILVVVLILVGLWGWRRVRQNNSPAHVPAAAVSAAMALTRSPRAAATQAAASPRTTTATQTASATGSSGVHLDLDVKTPCWVEVYAPDGERLYYNLAPAGQRLSFDSTNGALTVFLGNTDGVDVLVDGKPFSIPAGAQSGNTARFQVGARGSPIPATSSGT